MITDCCSVWVERVSPPVVLLPTLSSSPLPSVVDGLFHSGDRRLCKLQHKRHCTTSRNCFLIILSRIHIVIVVCLACCILK